MNDFLFRRFAGAAVPLLLLAGCSLGPDYKSPSLEVQEQRLRARGTESEAAIQRRLQGARQELERAGEYNYQVINDDLGTAVAEVRAIIAPGAK